MNIEIKHLSIGYEKKTIISNINLTAKKGELIALIGTNGTGKSTLLRTISGLQRKKDGEINVLNNNINNYTQKELAKIISFVSTKSVSISNLSVYDLISFGRTPYTNWFGTVTNEDKSIIESAIKMVGMQNFLNKNIDEISDGEKQRVMIARTLAQNTPIILLDEPTAFLDLPNRFQTINLLNKLSKEQNKTIIFSTHDLNIAIQEADKIWIVSNDNILEGAPEDLILSGDFDKTFLNNKIAFNNENGNFELKKTKTKSIKIIGDGKYYFWAKKALERNNFEIICNKNKCSTVIQQNIEKSKWIVHKENKEFKANSIYEMLQIIN